MRSVDRDPELRAEIRSITPLLYRAGADTGSDRPAHVRSGSGLSLMGARLVVVQDDAGFLGIVDPSTGAVEAVPLPVPDGVRQWDEIRGNKPLKPDLEACVALEADTLLGFGSGSTPARERILVCTGVLGSAPHSRWVSCASLYAVLRATTGFSGSEMNVEGAAVVGEFLRLFNRGNGAPHGPDRPVNATCDLRLDELVRYLAAPGGPPPQPLRIEGYRLGSIGGAPLGFTDAAPVGAGVLFSAAAESSPDTYHDGPVLGSAVGYLDESGGGWAPLERDGEPFVGKVEGIAPIPGQAGRLWAVVDRDDPAAPSELCAVTLNGPWPT